MKCIKKVQTHSFEVEEYLLYDEPNSTHYQDLVFDICLYSAPPETLKVEKPGTPMKVTNFFIGGPPLGNYVIGLQKIKGQPMLFLDFAQRLFSIFENAQMPVQIHEEIIENMKLSPILKSN